MVTKHWGATGTYVETGEPIVIESAVSTYRLADGKIVEITMNFNTLDLMQQMGLIP
ncbi:MAG: hypothetical protein MAG451_02058 [Anaerolineales bacterium]|nr:hypothetical protein [Anaerolineales bacterium]